MGMCKCFPSAYKSYVTLFRINRSCDDFYLIYEFEVFNILKFG